MNLARAGQESSGEISGFVAATRRVLLRTCIVGFQEAVLVSAVYKRSSRPISTHYHHIINGFLSIFSVSS